VRFLSTALEASDRETLPGSGRNGDLAGESFLLRTNCERRALLLESCRQRGFGPKIVHRSEREDWIQIMVAAGRGVTLMPESLHLGRGTTARC
jgi:DNA-binding transcriptional LysR family regulator